MAASMSAAYATYANDVILNDVLKVLGQGRCSKEQIFMLLSPKHPVAVTLRESSMQPFECTDVATAGLIGWLSDFGAVVIPTFGFFMRSAEFFHALEVGRESIVRRTRSGTLGGLGFPVEDAERLEHQVREVGALVYVSCRDVAQSRSVLELLRAAGADEADLLQPEVPVQPQPHELTR